MPFNLSLRTNLLLHMKPLALHHTQPSFPNPKPTFSTSEPKTYPKVTPFLSNMW